MKKILFCILTIVSIQSCRVTVTPISNVFESNQDHYRYKDQEFEYITTRSASQLNVPILLSDILMEMKVQYGDVTISNIRKQSITEKGNTTYYMVFDVVKVVKPSIETPTKKK
jgi:hypothetical protein